MSSTKIEFTDNSIKVIAALERAAEQWLHEAAGEMQSAVQRNTRTDSGKTKGSWDYKVDISAMEATIGNPLENAIWEEYGTGEYAINGDGRRGGWYIHESKLNSIAKGRMKKVYGKGGKVFYYTKGKKPSRAFQTAYDGNKAKLIERAQTVFKGVSE